MKTGDAAVRHVRKKTGSSLCQACQLPCPAVQLIFPRCHRSKWTRGTEKLGQNWHFLRI